jgi:hypothetical protein
VTLPSDFGFGIGASGCAVSNRVFARSFILQDANAAVLVVYGLEPPSQDNADAARMVHINNARKYDMAILGNRMRLTVTRVQNYGSSGNNIPIITDFSNPVVISTRNSVPYSTQTSAFVRASDLYHMRRIEGYVSSKPLNVECSTGTRQFQYDYQSGYSGELCLGAVSACGSLTCTCSATKLKFHLSHNLGAGTLSGFDTGNSFSYTLAAGAKVRLTGPIYVPGQGGADSTLALMLGLKVQVETLR